MNPSEPGDARPRLGMVVSGSLKEGLDSKLDPDCSIEGVRVGRYVMVEGERNRFFCMVSDLKLQTTDPALAVSPPDLSDPVTAQVIRGSAAYGVAHLTPSLILDDAEPDAGKRLKPVRTIPPHYSHVFEATQEEIESVFGPEDERHLWIGSPLDMEGTRVRLDIPRLVERSIGVFGKSGTGKTFLTRILMAGILQKRGAVQLIFDMHNEYGWQGTSEGRIGAVKGLKQLFGSQVAVFTLDEASSKNRQVPVDKIVEIGFTELEAEDVKDSAEALGLNENQVMAVERVARRLGRGWLSEFLEMEGKDALGEFAQGLGEHEGTLSALQRRLRSLARLDFLVQSPREDSVKLLLDYLLRQKTVVLEFGRYRSNSLAQVLVANMLSRRIYDKWQDRVEGALGDRSQEPPQLVITIEEAHKFLNPRMAGQTVFGTIAREMRKYKATLLVVDQRPSAIDSEVLSQIGTKISCLLDEERDVAALLAGAPAVSDLRGVLARLDSKQQALIFGHAVPMPVVVETREYGSEGSYADFGFAEAAELDRRARQDRDDLYGP